LFVREIKTEYRGHQIVVRNSWGKLSLSSFLRADLVAAVQQFGDETKLYVDGKVVDSTNEIIITADGALLRTCIEESGNRFQVEVYAAAGWLKNLIKVCIDGKKVAGDDF
jgi:hypothetical protein